jgi:hypothetical protein
MLVSTTWVLGGGGVAGAQPLDTGGTLPVDVDPETTTAEVKESTIDDATRQALLIGGGVTLGVAYALPIIVAAPFGFRDQAGFNFIPIAGPIISIFARQGCDGEAGCPNGTTFIPLGLVASSLAQAAGAGVLLAGVLYSGSTGDPEPVGVSPVFGAGVLGLTTYGRF